MDRSKAIDDMLIELKSPDESARWTAVIRLAQKDSKMLSNRQTEELQGALSSLLSKDVSSRVRAGAALALRGLQLSGMETVLLKVMLHDRDSQVRALAGFSLSIYVRDSSSKALYSAFVQALNDKDWRVVSVAVDALREGNLYNGWEISEALRPLLSHSNWWVRLSVSRILVDLEVVDNEVIHTLTQLLRQHGQEIYDLESAAQNISRICEKEEALSKPFVPLKEKIEHAQRLLRRSH